MGKTNSKPTNKAAGLSKILKKQRAFGMPCYKLSDEFLKQPAEGDPSKRNFQLLNYYQGQAVAASRDKRLAISPQNVPNIEEYVPNGDGGAKDKIIANIGIHLDGKEGMFRPCISLYVIDLLPY